MLGQEPSAPARAMVRPYVITGGRTTAHLTLPLEALIQASPGAGADLQAGHQPAVLSPRDLAALRERISGPVYGPADEGFRIEQVGSYGAPVHRPAAVIGARDRGDVQAAVQLAAERGLPIAVQATGHSSLSRTDGALVISTRRMRQVAVDPRTRRAWLGAGVIWRDVLDVCTPHGLAPLCGSAPGVGAIGYTLGGGLSPIGRTYGYSADYVCSLEVVTADGRIRHVDPGHDPDLFWALRGGKGNFGVVTAMEIELFAEPSLYGGGLFFRAQDAEPVLRRYLQWAPQLPESCTTSIALLRDSSGMQLRGVAGGQGVVHLRVAYLGPAEQGSALLAPMRAAAPLIGDTVAPMPFTAIGDVHEDPTTPVHVDKRGALLSDATDDTATALLSAYDATGDSVFCVELRQLGGAFSRRPAVGSCAGHRDAAYLAFTVSAPAADGAASGGQRVLGALRPWSTGGVAMNFLGSANDPRDVASAWDPDSHRRLLELKHVWDPANLFRFGYPLLAEPPKVSPEAKALLSRCHDPTSIAELAAGLGLPLGVVRVLLTDLIEAGLVTAYQLDPERAGDTQLLKEVLHELRRRL
ncbi:FAD-binding protein [Amycolatopsis acidiphila]|uniref:FAD-binding protein n=1 Tax=Amycolatopsis acidiphila TaxID=715473 RepID=A0A558ADU3_9PSEU|nr:FAD-binding protein [Amycolatopsis acidiphila]TVT22429.1 FAD-binding protein [Amycolatopsis acidiphila]UIJ57630.1 FAD-binding protein [Amycolatopsis acidiphila]GHG89953.1 FAD-linked oxidase [Amycolatopsis acidiphila]